MAEQQKKPAAEQKKRTRYCDNAEVSGGKKSSGVLEVTCSPAATISPASPSPVYTRTRMLAAPSPFAMAKPMVKPTSKVEVSGPVAGVAPALAAPSPVTTMTTPARAAPSTKAVVEPEDGGVPEQAGGATVAVAAEEEAVGGLTAKKKLLHCATCSAPLKPPIFVCGDAHAVCCACGGGGGGGNKHCGACGRVATYTHHPFLDSLVGTLEWRCPNNKFGCQMSIPYHAVEEHKARCAHAPCYCLECTPPFEGSPASLVRHLTEESGRHRWPAPEKIKYGTKRSLVVQASEEDHRRLLVAEEDGGVFLVALAAVRGAAGVRPVTVVCVRGSTGARATPAYMGMLRVKGPPDEQGYSDVLALNAKMASCAVPGDVDMVHGRLRGHVIPEMLHGESKEVHLDICIENFPHD